MTTLTLNITRTAKTADVKLDPDTFLNSVTSLEGDWDYTAIKSQEEDWEARDSFNQSCTFKVNNYPVLSRKSNLLVQQVIYVLPDMSTVPGITVDNAFEIFQKTIKEEAYTVGLGEYQAWKQNYYSENFDQTCEVTTS